jgi:hypothetical protein
MLTSTLNQLGQFMLSNANMLTQSFFSLKEDLLASTLLLPFITTR